MDLKEFLVVAGETSADMHAASLIRELKALHPKWRFYGVGGPRMREQGTEILVPMDAVTVMGFGEVIPKLNSVRRALNALVTSATQRLPDAALLLDFPDFNLRLAARLRAFPIPVIYYISPQLWAWRESRVEQIRRLVDKLIVILPFEKEFYARHGIDAEYVGHPLLDHIGKVPQQGSSSESGDAAKKDASSPHGREGQPEGAPAILALLPGSRPQEVRRCLPVMLDTVDVLKSTGVRVAPLACLADSVREEAEPVCRSREVATASQAEVGTVLSKADAALVVSGTATLHCAVAGVPMVILYKTSWLNYVIARWFVRVPHIGLVNLVAGETCVPEFIQEAASPARLAEAVRPMLTSDHKRSEIRSKLASVRARLGSPGASARVAQSISRFMSGEIQSHG